MSDWVNQQWEWKWLWRCKFFEWEEELFSELKGCLDQVSMQQNYPDEWFWKPDSTTSFSVKSSYKVLLKLQVPPSLDQMVSRALGVLWHTSMPSKIQIFIWRLFLDRLPTRELLLRRNIISSLHGVSCAFCFREVESREHRFFTCAFSYGIWTAVLQWFGGVGAFQNGCINHFLQFYEILKGKRVRKVKNLVWTAVTWALWNMRNNLFFDGGVTDFMFVLNQIKILSCG